MLDVFDPHASGCGVLIAPPLFVPYRVYRDGVLILEGISGNPERFLDWDAPSYKEIVYRLETMGESDYAPSGEYRVTLRPELTYSAVDDGETYDVVNPRDALVVFFSTRLAQLARAGKLHVKNPNHKAKYQVTTAYQFEDSKMPVLVIDYADGESSQGDIGYEYSEGPCKMDFMLAANTKEERDAVWSAVTGLWKDIEWFLDDLGVMSPMLTNKQNSVQEVEPLLYTLSFSITGQLITWHGERSQPWQILNTTAWSAEQE